MLIFFIFYLYFNFCFTVPFVILEEVDVLCWHPDPLVGSRNTRLWFSRTTSQVKGLGGLAQSAQRVAGGGGGVEGGIYWREAYNTNLIVGGIY